MKKRERDRKGRETEEERRQRGKNGENWKTGRIKEEGRQEGITDKKREERTLLY